MKIPNLAACALLGFAGALSIQISQAQTSDTSPAQPRNQATATSSGPSANLDPWPRTFEVTGTKLRVFQPQVEKWEGNRLDFRAAVEASDDSKDKNVFGVVWGEARTDVNRPAHMVTLEDLKLTRSNFPTLSDNGDAYRKDLEKQLSGTKRTIALDRLKASLSASGTVHPDGVEVRNEPPDIIVSYSPAILIPVSGQPVIKKVPDSHFERVINTRALMLRQHGGNTWYLHVYDGWLSAASIQGPWSLADKTPKGIDELAKKLVHDGQADLLDGEGAKHKPLLANGVPTIYVTETTAELIVFRGSPDLQPVASTELLQATNTTSDVFVDTSDNTYYVLISGRWFSIDNLDKGPWQYVASNALPAEFKKIPPDSKAGVVLASIAGTPQAREALIANTIPQTATVKRQNGPEFTPRIDGTPQWRKIEGTSLEYVFNSEAPIIRTPDGTLYALSAGVWFQSNLVEGPWTVATSVPKEIYTIPPSSPLYYATFVNVYGYTPEVVYMGYTPGYLGTVVEPDGVVVYGTGYDYTPWVGDVYYAAPETYGVQAQPVYNPGVDLAYGVALGLTTAAMVDAWGDPYYYEPYYYGYPCCGSTSANVYRHWGNTAVSGTDTWYTKSDGDIGEKSSGSYTNYRTGTTGNYSANRYYNPYQGTAGRSMQRSINTQAGGTGNVSRNETYNAQKGETTYSSNVSGTTKGGSTVNRQTTTSWGAQGDSASRQTTVTNAQTGQTHTVSSGYNGNDRYASADGNNYRNDGSGWQKQTSNGWQDASKDDTSWADREQQARNQGEDRLNQFSQSGDANRFGGDGGGDRLGGGAGIGGNRLGGGALGGRFGGGFGGRFGGGGFGGRFGGFRGRR